MKIEHISKLYNSIFRILNKWLSPLWFFSVRYWLASTFFSSGRASLSDWQHNVELFKYEFQIPFISPEIAAVSSTAVELICPILLVLGLGTRLAALGLFLTSLIIELTYAHYMDHIVWMFASSILVFKGAEKLSLDYVLSNTLFKRLNN